MSRIDDSTWRGEHPADNYGRDSPEQAPVEAPLNKPHIPQSDWLALLDLTDWVYFRLDASGRITQASQRLALLLSATAEELLGVPLVALLTPPHDRRLIDFVARSAAPATRKIRTDPLRLASSLRIPLDSSSLGYAVQLDPAKYPPGIRPSVGTTSTGALHSSQRSDIPVELVMVLSDQAAPSPSVTDEESAIHCLLRVTPQDVPDTTGATAIELATLLEAERQQVQRQLQALAGIGRLVATSEDLYGLMDYVVHCLTQEFHYDAADVLLLRNNHTIAVLGASSYPASCPPTALADTAALQFPVSGQGIVGRVVGSGQPVLVEGPIDHPDDILLRRRLSTESALAMPLAGSRGVIGVLVVHSNRPQAFSLDSTVLLSLVADQLAIAIENSSLLAERDQRLAEVTALNQIGTLLASPGELLDTLDAIIRRVRALFQVEAASLMLVEDGRLHFKVASGTHIDEIKPFTLEMGQGIAGWVVQHNQTLLVNSVATDPRHYPGIDQTISFDTRSLIAAPLRIAKRVDTGQPGSESERVIGVLEIINRLDGRPFTHSDEVLIEFIASSAAVVIENVRLFNELQRRLAEMSALLDTSRAVTTLELQAVLDTIVERVSTILDAQQAIVFLLDETAQQLVPQAAHCDLHEEVRAQLGFRLGQGSVGTIAASRQPLHVDGPSGDPRLLGVTSYHDEVRCTLGVPLTVQSDLIGVLQVMNKLDHGHFTPADERLLAAFAGQAALAIHNARLYREVRRRVDGLATLGVASEAINRAERLNEIADVALDTASALMPHNRGVALLLRETQADDLGLVGWRGHFESVASALDAVNIEGSEDQGIRLISDSLLPDWRAPSTERPQSLIGVPLRGKEDVLGLIVIQAGWPTSEIGQLLQTLGDMVATAIEKAHLQEETSRRLAEVSTLYTLANQVTADLDLEHILESTVNIISYALNGQGCCLFLHDPQAGEPTLRASSYGKHHEHRTADLELISQVSRQVLHTRRPINLTNIKSPQNRTDVGTPGSANNSLDFGGQGGTDTKQKPTIRSLLVVPLISQNALIGTLSIDDRIPDAFGPAEGQLLTIAAAQVSVAIENARLLRNLQNRATQLELGLEKLRELHQLKTEFVQNLSHELRQPLTFVKGYVQLILDEAMGAINPDVRTALTIVEQRTDAITRLVNDVISLEEIQRGKLEFKHVSIAEIAAQSIQGVRVAAGKGDISIELQAQPDLPSIRADPGRIGQVFDNLLGNAVKFSPAGSCIKVRICRDGAFVRSEVQDQGIGIPEDKLDQIFDRFFQVDGSTTRRYGGTGLGLAIVRSIVESHGGHVAVESQVGVGSTFAVFLPVARSTDSQ